MTRTPSKKLLATAPLLLLLASPLGCLRSNQSTLELGALCYPTDDCTFSSTCDKIWMTGLLWVDLQVGNGLVWPIQLDNQRPNNSDSNGGVNTNNAVIDRFEMRYEVNGVIVTTASFQQSIVVPAEGSTVAGIWLIPPGSAAATTLAGQPAGTIVSVKLKAAGSFNDGTSFDTAEHPIAVQLGNGTFTGYACSDNTKTPTICPPNAGQSANVVCQ